MAKWVVPRGWVGSEAGEGACEDGRQSDWQDGRIWPGCMSDIRAVAWQIDFSGWVMVKMVDQSAMVLMVSVPRSPLHVPDVTRFHSQVQA